MKGICSDILVKAIHGTDDWELLEPFKFHVGTKDSTEIIIVPKGFRTDFASIPAPVKAFINPVGKIKPAALVHDYLYNLRGKYEDRNYSRKDCDKIFLHIMEIVGMDWVERHAAYRGVRLGGWYFWNKTKKN